MAGDAAVGGDTAGGAEVLGLFGTAWALMQFLFSPTLGAVSDRYGRRALAGSAGVTSLFWPLAAKVAKRRLELRLAAEDGTGAWPRTQI